MKKKLEAELISIAHRILKLRNKSELIQLHQETQKLYEKLSVLLFVEENFGETKPTIGYHEMLTNIEQVFEQENVVPETEIIASGEAIIPAIEENQPTEEIQSVVLPTETETIVAAALQLQENESTIEIEDEIEIATENIFIPEAAIIADNIEDITSIELSANNDEVEINEVELLETESAPVVISEIENEIDAVENEVEEDLDEITLIEEAITLTTSEETKAENTEVLELDEPVLEPIKRPTFEFNFKTIDEIENEKKEKINQFEVVENAASEVETPEESAPLFTPSFESVEEPTFSPKSNIKQISLEELLGVSDPNPIFERVVPLEKKEEFHFEPTPIAEEPKIEQPIEPAPVAEIKPFFEPVFEPQPEPILPPKVEIKAAPVEEEQESRFSWLKSKLEPKIVQKPVTGNRIKKSITFGLNDKIAFEKHLFHGSSEDLNRVISQLSTYDTLHEAVDFIETMVKPDYNYWEGKDEYVKRFMEIVEKRFA